MTGDAQGFLPIRQGEQSGSSNPARPDFVAGLAGATVARIRQIWIDAPQNTAPQSISLRLNGWSTPGRLAVESARPLFLAGTLQTGELLTLHAPQLTVAGDLQSADLRLASAAPHRQVASPIRLARQGAAMSVGGNAFQISYQGGDGNDVVLTAIQAPTGGTSKVYLPVVMR